MGADFRYAAVLTYHCQTPVIHIKNFVVAVRAFVAKRIELHTFFNCFVNDSNYPIGTFAGSVIQFGSFTVNPLVVFPQHGNHTVYAQTTQVIGFTQLVIFYDKIQCSGGYVGGFGIGFKIGLYLYCHDNADYTIMLDKMEGFLMPPLCLLSRIQRFTLWAMAVDPSLFERQAAERLEAELLERSRVVMDTDERLALANLFELVGGYALHLQTGMETAGFESQEASTQAWRTAWGALRRVLDTETHFIHDLATTLERNLGGLHDGTVVTDTGEPTDPLTRTFYQTFITKLEHPGVHPTAAWLYEV